FFFFSTSPGQRAHHAVVAFVTGIFEYRSRTLCKRDLDGPRLRECLRVINSKLIQQCGLVQPFKPLGKFHVLARTTEWRLVGEIRRLDHERVSLPVSAGIPLPLTNSLRKVRPRLERYEPNFVAHLDIESNISWTLHNLSVVVVCRRRHRRSSALQDQTSF